MSERDWLVEQFEANRAHLRAVAYRMLGSASEADDAVQESWLRLSRADTTGVANLGGWLTTVVARVCLDMLRSRASRREEPLEVDAHESMVSQEGGVYPEHEALLADSVGLALLVVLDTLTPAERLAFVLHDLFDVPFEEIAPIVGRTPTAARQLASRARRRVRGQRAPTDLDADLTRHRKIVDAFLAASRAGDFDALLELLDPEVVAGDVRGAHDVAKQFVGRAKAARAALINGAVGFVWAPGLQPRAAFNITFRGDKIIAIELIADPARLRQLDVRMLDN